MGIFLSLRARLLGIVFIAVIPAFILLLYMAANHHSHEEAKARAETLNLTRFAAGNIKQIVEGSRQVLTVLSKLKAVQDYDSAACRDFFTDINKHYPMYNNISAAKPDGDVFCRSHPTKKKVNVADRPWFQRAVKTRSFSFGDYQIGKASGKPEIRAALPVIDKEGHLKAVVGVSIDLGWFNEQLTKIKIPEKTSVTVIDSQGTVIARYPHPEKWLGKKVAEADIVRTVLTKEEGTVESKGIAGVDRIFSFMPIRGTDKGMYIVLGISTDVAFAEAKRSLIQNLIWLTIIALMASAAAWFGGDIFIMRRMRKLMRATNELSIGNLSARVDISTEKDEIDQLGHSFNKMAATLEQNIGERKRVEEELKKSIRQVELMNRELSIGLSEVFNALQKISSGDPTIRIDETSEIELIARLKHMVNLTAENIGEIVSLSHEFAIGLTEHFDILHRVSKGDLNARVSGSSQVELLESLKKITNEMIDNISRDITERKQAEEKLRNIIEHSNELFYTHDTNHKLIYISPQSMQILGYSPDEIVIEWTKLTTENPINRTGFEITEKALKTGEKQEPYLLEFNKKDGSKVLLEIDESPLKDDMGKVIGMVGAARDITERKKLEEQFLQAQKMEAIGRLTGGIAHDFNNILQAIMSIGGLLQIKIKEGDPLKEYINDLFAVAERAASLTKSLLAFSRKQIISLMPINLNDIIKNAEKILSMVMGEDIELKTNLSDKDLVIMADSGQIEQVLMNLATNSRDAMPEGGQLIIETDTMEMDDEYIKTHGYGKAGKYALMTVTDTGIGMDEETKKKLFEPFFTTKEVGKGTGLGLSTVYGIVKQHNGYINVYSEVGGGTAFKIYLPIIKPDILEKTEFAKEGMVYTGGTETILIAEDDEPVRKLTKETLERAGYKVIDAVDGDDAMEKFMEHKDEIQLLLLDVIMPKRNGREVYDEIRKIRPEVRVIFVSGYPADFIATKGIIEEGLNYIAKPLPPNQLLKKIREALT